MANLRAYLTQYQGKDRVTAREKLCDTLYVLIY